MTNGLEKFSNNELIDLLNTTINQQEASEPCIIHNPEGRYQIDITSEDNQVLFESVASFIWTVEDIEEVILEMERRSIPIE